MQRTHETIRGMSCLNGLPKIGMGSVVVAQVFKNRVSKHVTYWCEFIVSEKGKWAQ